MSFLVLDRDAAAAWAREHRGEGRKVVFTNGCFDLLHRGHVDLLEAARALGDVLVVGVNDDDSVRRLKGADRPWVVAEDRARVLAALRAVDRVVVFPEDTPRELIVALRPSFVVKGGDYRPQDVVGGPEAAAWGGEVRIIPLTPGRSSTRIRERREGPPRDPDPPR